MELIIILLAAACGNMDTMQEAFPDYFVTCLPNERYHLIAQQTVDPILYEYYHAVFVTVDKQSPHLGYSDIEENWAWCQPSVPCIGHEALHLREGYCTSDGKHVGDSFYVRGEWVTCAEARA